MINNIRCICIDANKHVMSKNTPKDRCFSLSALLRPVECLPCETRSMFLWGGAYSSGVSRKEKETLRPLRLERLVGS
jgi:hypothetical protein